MPRAIIPSFSTPYYEPFEICSVTTFAEIDDEVEYNGHVEAAAALARVLGSVMAPALQPLATARPGTVHCTWLLAVSCCLLALACSSSLFAAYAWYVCIMGMLQVQLCVVQAQAAALVAAVDVAPLFGILALCTITLQSSGQVPSLQLMYCQV